MKRILWVSRNKPLDSQLKELRRLFGQDTVVDLNTDAFSDADDIIARFKKGKYDEMLLIAPLSVCRIITDKGFKPLYSEMVQDKSNFELEVKGRRYRFVKFKRLESVKVEFSQI